MADQKTPTALLPGNVYQGLGYGPDIQFEYEEQPEERRPIEGSNSFLRQLSPFRISFVLPGTYGNLRRADGTASFTRDVEQQLDASARVRAVSGLQAAVDFLLGQRREELAAAEARATEAGEGFDFTEEDVAALEAEAQRAEQERGIAQGVVPMTRAIGRPYINDQYDRLYDAAQTRFDSFQEAKQAAKSAAQFEQTYARMGATLARVESDKFIVNGEERTTAIDPNDPRGTDKNQALDIATQLLEMMNTPPLVLLINPINLSTQRNRIMQFTERTRNGYLLQDWGSEQVTLNITVKCGAFISAGRGVQYASKRDSASWQNMMQLFQVYKSNGYIYDRLGKSNAMHGIGSIAIEYDGWVYVGNFNSLSYSYDQAAQHGGVEFEMEFTVNYLYDNAPPVTAPLEQMKSITPPPTSTGIAATNLRALVDQAEGDGGVEGFVALFGGGPSSAGAGEGDGAQAGAAEDVPSNTSGFDGA